MKFEDIQRIINSLPKINNQNDKLFSMFNTMDWTRKIQDSIKQPNILSDLSWAEKINQINRNFSATKNILDASVFNNVNYSNNYQNIFQQIEKLSNSGILEKIPNTFKFQSYDFAELIEGYEEEQEELVENPEQKISEIILDETSRIKSIIFEIYLNNQKLYDLHPREFEKMIAELLYNKGFDVELTKQTRDNGYDILALKYLDGFSPIKYLVECKKYAANRKIGVEIVRGFRDVLLTEQANKGIIVTTSYFSKDAILKQQENPLLLDYKDKNEVINWVNEYYSQKTYR